MITALYILHMLGLAGIVVGYVMQLNDPTRRPLMVWSARLQLLIGLALVGAHSMNGAHLDYAWVTVKLLVALGVVACCEIGTGRGRRGEDAARLFTIAAGLTFLNAAIAWLWH